MQPNIITNVRNGQIGGCFGNQGQSLKITYSLSIQGKAIGLLLSPILLK